MWKILLIEDDEDDYILTRDLLAEAREGEYQLEWAKDYPSGIEATCSDQFDAVLVDYYLGPDRGVELVRRAAELNIRAPIILLTGAGGYKGDLEALQAGADDYLDKKLLTTVLLEKSIRYAIEHKNAERTLRQERAGFQMIIDNAPSGVIFTDRAGQFTVTNPAARQMLGGRITGTAAEPEGRYTLRHRDGTPFKPDELPLYRALQGVSSRGVEMTARLEDGREVYLSVNCNPVLDEKGGISGAVAVMQDVTSLVEAEQSRQRLTSELSQQEELLNTLFENDPGGLAILVEEGAGLKFVLANPAYRAMTPHPEIDPLGKRLEVIWPPSEGYTPWKIFHQALKGQTTRIDHQEHVRPDGSTHYYTLHLLPILLKNKRGILVINWETTQLVQAVQQAEQAGIELEVRQAEQEELLVQIQEERDKLETLVQNAPIGISIFEGPTHVITLANPVQYQIAPAQGDIIGKTYAEVWPRRAEKILPILNQVYLSGKPFSAMNVPFQTEGENLPEERFFSFTYTPLFDPEGEVTSIMALLMDTTEQVRMQKQIEADRARLQTILQQLPTGVLIAEAPSGKLIMRNDQVNKIWRRRAARAENVRDYLQYTGIHNDNREYQPEEWPILRSIKNGETVYDEEIRFLRGDGTEGTLQVSSVPIQEKKGEISAAVMVFSDITAMRALEAEKIQHMAQIDVQRRLIRQREMERLQIARNLHDGPFQTLNAANIGLMDAIIQDQDPEQLERLQWVQTAFKQQIMEMRQFIQELRPPALVSFGLETTIRSHLESFQQQYPDIQLEAYLDKDGKILSEETRLALYRIYQELISNAGRHAQANQVTVSLGVDAGAVTLEVKDNGIGFEVPEMWAELALSNHLGLIGIRERVEMIGAKIEIQSVQSQGTTVRVIVPRQ